MAVWTWCNYWVCCFAGKVKYSCIRSTAMDSLISHGTVAVIRTCCEDGRWMQLAQDNCSRLSSVSAEQNFRKVYLTTWYQQPFLIAVYSDQLTAVVACCYQSWNRRTDNHEGKSFGRAVLAQEANGATTKSILTDLITWGPFDAFC